MSTQLLNPTRALIFRIVHVRNVPWILEHGLVCRNSPKQNPHYLNIGNVDLIDKRSHRVVPIPPGGTLSDYVPFYFTPWSIMLYNIHTGWGGITRRANSEIVFFVSSIPKLLEHDVPFIFTNQHAYPVDTDFYSDPAQLSEVDWPLLQRKDFKTDDENPGKQLRYQAEVLVHRRLPRKAMLGLVCHDEATRKILQSQVAATQRQLSVEVRPLWYFS